MNKLIEKIGLDKLAHLGIGGLVCALFTFVVILQDANTMFSGNMWRILLTPFIGTVVVMFLEFFKEYFSDSEFSWKDVLYTFAGCFLVFVAVGIGLLFNQLSNSSY